MQKLSQLFELVYTYKKNNSQFGSQLGSTLHDIPVAKCI